MIHKASPLDRLNRERPAIIAHRGASGHAPENTLFAAKLAREMGADMWELDAGLSKDGHLEVLHDDTLERTTNVARLPRFQGREPYRLADFTHEELRELDARGTWRGPENQERPALERSEDPDAPRFKIPSLKEALLLTKELDWTVNIEIKDHADRSGHAQVVRRALDLVRETGMSGRALVSSFNHEYLGQARALMPELALAVLVDTEFKGDVVAVCKECGARFCHPQAEMCDKAFMNALRQAEIAVNVWTVNEPEAMRAFIAAGADGIITNYPDRLSALLAGR